MVTPSAAPTGIPIAPAGPFIAAPPLDALIPARAPIGNSEAHRAGGHGGAEPLRPGAGEAGAPILDNKRLAPIPDPPRTAASIFRPVTMSLHAWQADVAARLRTWAHLVLPRGKRRRDWAGKAAALFSCGQTVVSRRCGTCRTLDNGQGAIVALCRLRICPICARRRAHLLRERLRLAMLSAPKHRRMALYFLTLTLRFDPSEPADVSIDGLRRRKDVVMSAWQVLWIRYLKGRGSAGARAVEVGAKGMVHLHILYNGRRPDVNLVRQIWMFSVGDSPQIHIDYVRRPMDAINELAKYITKGSSPAKANVLAGCPGTFVDPELAARVEVAFFGDRLLQCYGDWRKSVSVDEGASDEQTSAPTDEASVASEACPHCGTCGSWEDIAMGVDEWIERVGTRWKPSTTGIKRIPGKSSTNSERKEEPCPKSS